MTKTGTTLLRILTRLQDVHPDMTVLQARMFATIAANPGITQRRLYDNLGSNDSTASRILAILGEYGGRTVPPLNLIEMRVNPHDRRERLLHLSKKGERLMRDIGKDMGHADL